MKIKAYKLNINQFTALCVENGAYIQIFTPRQLGKACAVVPLSWKINGETVEIDTGENSQLEHGQIIIITDIK